MVAVVNQLQAQEIDNSLFNKYGFSVEQLMELAGLSCAQAIAASYPNSNNVIVICGPGNNGGDGLVCARHLSLFGYKSYVYYPNENKKPLFQSLVTQCKMMDIPVSGKFPNIQSFDLIIDAIFGFGYKYRPSIYEEILRTLADEKCPPICSIDVPSGWEIDNTDSPQRGSIQPDCLISLTVPKLCSLAFTGRFHWLGGRFLNEKMKTEFNIQDLPEFPETNQCVLLNF
ncbi:hypothetical protein GJ496_005240 [Pomphorhynchus laevis]|nr:hypothetical protein GJ496_005240 [Pomphorhynchus laevis]